MLERMIEAWEHLCTVDIIDFVNELVIDCVNFSKEIVFSQVVVIGADRLEQMMFEAPLRQVDIIDGFVNNLVIDCVNFCKTGCVFTGGQEDHAGE